MTAEETVTAYWRAWTEHNRDLLLRLLAPDFVSRSSLSNGRPAGKDLIAKGFHMFDRALPNLREEVVSMVSEGDRVACEVVETVDFYGSDGAFHGSDCAHESIVYVTSRFVFPN
jgi:ketosteroid isomerase-like protein